MKKLLLIFALFFSHFFQINAQKDKLDQLFEKYQETDGVTSIKIAKPMFNMLNKLNIADDELAQIKPLLSKINGLKILIVEKPDGQKPQNQFQKLQADISSSIKSMKYEELMTVNSKDNKIKFLSSDATNGILDNLLLSINADGNTVLMMLDGKISMDDVNNLINEAEKSATKSSVTTENITSNGITQVRNVGKFTGVSVSSGIKVNFTQGNNQSVVVDTDPNMQQYISTEVENGILVIKVKDKNNKNLNFKKLLVTIEAPRLSSVKVSSGSLLTTLNTINEDNFKTDISSGANLNADLNIKNTVSVDISSGSSARIDMNTSNFEFEGTSGSMATIVGTAQNIKVNMTSAATCNAQDLISKNGSANVSSGANLKIQVTDNLTATATSGASIRYKGTPKSFNGSAKSVSGGSIKPLN
ncbi:DUF4252 domain-containing protein [Kaistella flava (ex Peng et al. 2021)]|uniref:DUF4252 domain-containing protein n=1 Tax=Kaistella flava (ex Peng et al. 2021) TaxID=2038776 RepID=A0A7M2YCI5_9FLAO|nr:DUF4252 domain-containing protein [Kaistella flava (ex Peng et al. 2021)]QOW11529.1 DUF4252 domain-containing protein [Kaistella flava (ex Peng et al. 2021)]